MSLILQFRHIIRNVVVSRERDDDAKEKRDKGAKKCKAARDCTCFNVTAGSRVESNIPIALLTHRMHVEEVVSCVLLH